MNALKSVAIEDWDMEQILSSRIDNYDGNSQILRAAMSAYVGSRAPARLLEIVSEITSWLLDLEEKESRVLIKKIMH
jgi:hypothetical protein